MLLVLTLLSQDWPKKHEKILKSWRVKLDIIQYIVPFPMKRVREQKLQWIHYLKIFIKVEILYKMLFKRSRIHCSQCFTEMGIIFIMTRWAKIQLRLSCIWFIKNFRIISITQFICMLLCCICIGLIYLICTTQLRFLFLKIQNLLIWIIVQKFHKIILVFGVS